MVSRTKILGDLSFSYYLPTHNFIYDAMMIYINFLSNEKEKKIKELYTVLIYILLYYTNYIL